MASQVKIIVNYDKTQLNQLRNELGTLTSKKYKVNVNTSDAQKVIDSYNKSLKNQFAEQKKYADWWTKELDKQEKQQAKIDAAKEKALQKELKLQQEINAKRGESVGTLNIGSGDLDATKAIRSIDGLNNATVKAIGTTKIADTTYQQFIATTKNASGGFDQYTISVNTATGETYKFSNGLQSVDNAATRSADNIVKLMGKVALWSAATTLVFAPLRRIKESITEIEAVDKEMVAYRKATGATTEEVERLTNASYEYAKSLGSTASAYVKAVAEFGKAGYAEQAEELAKLALMTQTVGDVDEEIAQQFLLATDKAYKFNGSIEELTKVLDGANEIGNRFATNVEKLAEGLGLVAPLAAQAGIEVNELMAAIGTITAVTQRSGSEAARAFRALVLNLQQVKGEVFDEETGEMTTTESLANTEKVLLKNNIAIREMINGVEQLRNPMEIIAELSQKVKEGAISEVELAEITTVIGGKLRSSQLVALIQNFDMYQEMVDTYANSTGSAMKELSIYMDSIEAKQNKLNSSWAELTNQLLSPSTMKSFLDFANGVVEALTWIVEKMGGLKGILIALSPLIAVAFAVLIAKLVVSINKLTIELGLLIARNIALGNWIAAAAAASAALAVGVVIATSANKTDQELLQTEKDLAEAESQLAEEESKRQEEQEALEAAQKEYSDSLDEINEKIETYSDNLNTLSDAIDKVREGTKLSSDEIIELLDLYPELASKIEFTANGYMVEAEALRKLRQEEQERYIKGLQEQAIAEMGGVNGFSTDVQTGLETLFGELTSATSYEEAKKIAEQMAELAGGGEDEIEKVLAVWAKVRLSLTDINDELEKQYDTTKSQYDEQIEALEEIIKKKEQEREENQKIYDLEKARLELANAQAERTVKVFRNGEWVWEADQEAIDQAKENLEDLEYEAELDKLNELKDQLTEEQEKVLESILNGENIDKSTLDKLLGTDLTDSVLSGNVKEMSSAEKEASYYGFTGNNDVIGNDSSSLTKQINSNIINNNGDTFYINGIDITDKVKQSTLDDLKGISYAYAK